MATVERRPRFTPKELSERKRYAKAVGERIRTLRYEMGLGLRDIEVPGATHTYIHRVERGDRVPSLSVLIKLAEKLNTSALYLATGDYAHDCPFCGRVVL